MVEAIAAVLPVGDRCRMQRVCRAVRDGSRPALYGRVVVSEVGAVPAAGVSAVAPARVPALVRTVETVQVPMSTLTVRPGVSGAAVVALCRAAMALESVRDVDIQDESVRREVGNVLLQVARYVSVPQEVAATTVDLSHLRLSSSEDAAVARLLGNTTSVSLPHAGCFSQCVDALPALRSLSLTLHHGIGDFTSRENRSAVEYLQSRALSLEHLTLRLGCDNRGCECIEQWLGDISLPHTTLLDLVETSSHRHHDRFEQFDRTILSFAVRCPQLVRLAVTHAPPADGNIADGVEGNFMRRTALYKSGLLLLPRLQHFSSPTFITSCACYEQVVNDLLWNGCTCAHCAHTLAQVDEYVMTHQYYDAEEGDFRELIPARFFAAAGNVMQTRGARLPVWETQWDWHTGSDFECIDEDGCGYGQALFPALTTCLVHFEEPFVRWAAENVPGLTTVVLGGVVWGVGWERNGTRRWWTADRVATWTGSVG